MFSRQGAVLVLSFLSCVALTAPAAQADDVRYIACANGSISGTGAECTGPRAGDDGDAATENDPLDKTCEKAVENCFEVPPGCSAVLAGSSCVFGGSPAATEEPFRPYPFPRSVSRAGSITAPAGSVQVLVPGTSATADSFTGELTPTCGAITVRSEGAEDQTIQPGEGIAVPGGTVLGCNTGTSVADGLSVLTVNGAIFIDDDGNQTIFSQSIAGVEIPFTTGGAGCSVARRRGGIDTTVLGVLALLWCVTRRRRR